MWTTISLLTLMGSVPASVGADPAAQASIRAIRTSSVPRIDGHLDDEEWLQADPSDAFTQKTPNEGQAPTEKTRFQVLYDDDAVYIGIHCTQATTPVAQRLTRRDREAESGNSSGGGSVTAAADRVTVHIGSRRDGATAFQFGINAAGVLSDGVHFDDTMFSSRWDENWEGQTTLTSDGWSAEMRIPLRILRFDDEPLQNWGFNVRRYIAGRQEVDEWAFNPRTDPGVVSRFGELQELADLHPQPAIELSPFVVMQAAHDTLPGPTQQAWSSRVSAGLDGKWHPTPALTASATLNPDFAQVEADQVIFNLSSYEAFLPEKRPFFLEGAELYETPKLLLHTRRIGAAPGLPALVDGESEIAKPRPSAILGALKLTGQPVRGLSIGLLSAVTDRNEISVLDDGRGTPQEVRRLAAPRLFANALRAKLDTGPRSAIGFMATAANRIEEPGHYARIQPGADVPAATPEAQTLCPSGANIGSAADCYHDAYVGSLDSRWRSAAGNHFLLTQLAGSHIAGGPARTMADGTVIAPGDSDMTAVADFGKDGGNWLWQGYYNYTGKRFDYNDLGFQQAQNVNGGELEGGYRTTTPWSFIRDSRTTMRVSERGDTDWNRLREELMARSRITLDHLWRLEGRIRAQTRAIDQREIRGVPALFERSNFTSYYGELLTPTNKPLIAQASFEYMDKAPGSGLEATLALMLRTFSRVELDLLGSLETASGEPRYLSRSSDSQGTTQYRFAKLNAKGVSTTLRATLAMSPRLTLQAYGQLFLAYRRYGDFTSFESADPNVTIRQRDLRPDAPPASLPDARSAALNATVVLRWEYTLGSTLFLVYSRSQVPDATLASGSPAGLDFMSLPRAPAVDALMLKLSYWWA